MSVSVRERFLEAGLAAAVGVVACSAVAMAAGDAESSICSGVAIFLAFEEYILTGFQGGGQGLAQLPALVARAFEDILAFNLMIIRKITCVKTLRTVDDREIEKTNIVIETLQKFGYYLKQNEKSNNSRHEKP
jgi:hypothetical protein